MLPLELRQLVAAHLVDEDGEEQGGMARDRHEGAGEAAEGGQEKGRRERGALGRTIPHEVLVKVSRWAKRDNLEDADQYRLANLLRLTDVYAPPLQPREKIQLEQDRASYATLTSLAAPPHPSLIPLNDAFDPSRYGGKPKTAAEEWKEIRREVGAILNVGASMLAVGTAVWWVGGGRSYAARLSLAMAGAVAIAAIEAFLYYRFFTRHSLEQQELARRKAKRGSRGRSTAAAEDQMRGKGGEGSKAE
ncbi:hypothetical protein JCM10213v2_005707 [Rhodosporidiobolus nylandii]